MDGTAERVAERDARREQVREPSGEAVATRCRSESSYTEQWSFPRGEVFVISLSASLSLPT